MRKSRSHSDIILDAKRIITEDSPFAIKEAYRTLYTNIMYLPIENKCRRFVLTSAVAGEGKTSVSINLAYTIATTSPNARILLVDADMRSPRIAPLLNIASGNVHGLSEYLAGIDDTPSTITSSIYPNLDVLTSGAENTNTTALLSSAAMQRLSDFFNQNYDYVIIDTPPISLVTDAIFFREYTDGYLVIARADYSDVNEISEAVRVLTDLEANIFGFVLCSINSKRTKKYGKSKYDGSAY